MTSRPGIFAIVKRSVVEFVNDECPRMAAALSYYTVFSLPSLLILILLLAGTIWDPQDVRGGLAEQIDTLMGAATAEQLRGILDDAEQPGAGRPLAAVLGIAALLFGATGAFVELQAALNRAWNVEPDPEQGGVRGFLFKRLFSIGMVLTIAFLLLVSLALSTVLSAFGGTLGTLLPGDASETLLVVLDFAISMLVITLLFAAMFKVLPDARTAWRDVWLGAVVTTVLFLIGKLLIGFYLGRSNPGEAYGAAGSLAVLLVWVYYSAMILLLGAEFTQVWAESRGAGVAPEQGAVRKQAEEPAADGGEVRRVSGPRRPGPDTHS